MTYTHIYIHTPHKHKNNNNSNINNNANINNSKNNNNNKLCASSYCFRDTIIKNTNKFRSQHRVQFTQLRHSMANVKIYKCSPYNFVLALTVSDI